MYGKLYPFTVCNLTNFDIYSLHNYHPSQDMKYCHQSEKFPPTTLQSVHPSSVLGPREPVIYFSHYKLVCIFYTCV